MLDLVFQNFTKDKSFKRDFFAQVINSGIGELGLKDKSVQVSLSLVDQAKIRELNKRYRNKDKATDVLSFPMAEALEIGNWKLEIPKSNATAFDLGDIFICLSFAKNEAKRENVSIEKKLAQLIVHGFLHLAGYDHERSAGEAKKMLSLEDKILLDQACE